LPPVRFVTSNDQGSGAYRRDRDQLLKWILGFLALAAAAMLWRHEVTLSALSTKMDLLMEHFGLEVKK
jgi:hypothetical protein